MIINIRTIEEFRNAIRLPLVIVDFYSDHCGPCRVMDSILKKFSETDNTPILKINISNDSLLHLVAEYNVKSIPALYWVSYGIAKLSHAGVLSPSTLKHTTDACK